MDQKYDFDGWSSRWDEDRIGFHAMRSNPFLLQYWHHLDEIKPSVVWFRFVENLWIWFGSPKWLRL